MQRNITFSNRKNKYNSRKSEYNGRIYDSALECNYAIELDWRKKAKEIKNWTPQYKLDLRVNDIHITNYYVDFAVELNDGRIEFHEVKGYEADVWRIKWSLAKAIYSENNFVLIK